MKEVGVLGSHEIAWVVYLGQITNIGTVAHENYERSAPGKAWILACAIARTKEVVVSELREIARVAY